MNASRSEGVRERQAELLARARRAYEDGNYRVARELIDEILALDRTTEEAAAAERLRHKILRDLGPSRSAEGDEEGRSRGAGIDFGVKGVLGLPREDDEVREAAVEPAAPRAAPPAPPRPPGPRAAPPRPAGPAPGPEAAETIETLRRTPHMDVSPDPPLAAGQPFTVTIWADTGAERAGETSHDIRIDAPASVRRFEIEVLLQPTAHFRVVEPARGPLVIERDRAETERVTVDLQVVDDPAVVPGTPEVVAYLTYEGRPCGSVSREVAVEGVAAGAPAAAGGETRPRRDALTIEAGAAAADLQVDVVEAPARDGRTFTVTVRTPLLAAYAGGRTETWALPSVAKDLVADYMKEFTSSELTNEDRLLQLEGAGMDLFDAAPELFRRVFWEIVDAGARLEFIAIVSEEPYIPWELMVPTRRVPGRRREERKPLGVEFSVSRWSPHDHTSPPQRIPLADSVVVAPRDSGLEQAESEAEMVLAAFPGTRIDPAAVKALDRWLDEKNTSLLHFICHGESGVTQVLKLENGQVLNTTRLRAMDGLCRALEEGRPLVFINACQVGRPVPALVGTGGFAERFMGMGASGVVAALWSVRDSIAHKIAVEFYQRVQEEPTVPFAQILRDIRAKAYAEGGGEDTYAAYCFYGDPRATAAGA